MKQRWTQSLVVGWVPTLSYYEERTALLRGLESQGELVAFKVAHDEVRAFLPGLCELAIQPGGLEVQTFHRTADVGQARNAAQFVLQELNIGEIHSVVFCTQYLAELEGDYAAARLAVGGRVLGNLFPGRAQTVDFSVLADGEAEGSGASFQVEFGVLSAEEAPARLQRLVGRAGSSGTLAVPSFARTILSGESFPDVALFADWRWWLTTGLPCPADDLIDLWTSAEAETEALMEDLIRRTLN